MNHYVPSEDLVRLTLAGEAVGLRVPMYYEPAPEDGFPMAFAKIGKREYWNPYVDDGDCARIESALSLYMMWDVDCVSMLHPVGGRHAELFADHGGDRNAARRFATVRLAALVGEKAR